MFIFTRSNKRTRVNKGCLGEYLPPNSREARRRAERIARNEEFRKSYKAGIKHEP